MSGMLVHLDLDTVCQGRWSRSRWKFNVTVWQVPVWMHSTDRNVKVQ